MCGDLHMTRGEFDNAGSRYPEEKVRSLQDIGMVCGVSNANTGSELAVHMSECAVYLEGGERRCAERTLLLWWTVAYLCCVWSVQVLSLGGFKVGLCHGHQVWQGAKNHRQHCCHMSFPTVPDRLPHVTGCPTCRLICSCRR